MSRINPLTTDKAQGQAAELYSAIQGQLGGVPAIFQALGQTPSVLKAYFDMGSGIKTLSAVEKESIALTVAQTNSCNYCLAAHTAIGTKIGLSIDQTIAIRKGNPEDSKLKALVKLAREVVTERGYVSDATFKDFLQAGYRAEQVSEVILSVVQNIFTNYFNHTNKTEIDFPAAQKL